MKLLTGLLVTVAAPLLALAAAPSSGAVVPISTGSSTWNIDGEHSSVVFKTLHMEMSYAYGRFNKMEGVVHFDAAAPESSSIEIVIDAASVDTNAAKRDAHLRNSDFFSAKEFPKITFKSTKVTAGEDGDLKVTGDLSFHGVTKSIDLEIEAVGGGKDPWGGTRAGYHTTFEIDASEYAVKSMGAGGAVGPMVELMISLEVIQG